MEIEFNIVVQSLEFVEEIICVDDLDSESVKSEIEIKVESESKVIEEIKIELKIIE